MQTVNLLASVSVGSTPSLPTFRLLSLKVYDMVLSRPKCSVRVRQESYFRTGCVQFWNCSVLQDMNKANRTSEYNIFSYSSVGRASGC